MTLPLESLKLTPIVLENADSKADALSEGVTGGLMFAASVFLICIALILLAISVGTFIMSKKIDYMFWMAIAVGVGALFIGFLPKASYEYKADLSIENISMSADAAEVTFKSSDTLYTSTLPKDEITTLSNCRNITASRLSYKKLDDPTLGKFTADEKDGRCVLKGEE